MIRPCDAFGPWATGLDPAERLARLRSLRAIVRAYLGPRGQQFADWLRRAETDEAALVSALDQLAQLDRRRVLVSFAALHGFNDLREGFGQKRAPALVPPRPSPIYLPSNGMV